MSNVLALQTVSNLDGRENGENAIGLSSLWSIGCTCNETVQK